MKENDPLNIEESQKIIKTESFLQDDKNLVRDVLKCNFWIAHKKDLKGSIMLLCIATI